MKRSIASVWAITQKELKHYFLSPIAYVVLMIFLTVSGYFFFAGLVQFTEYYKYLQSMMQFYRNPEMLSRINLNEMVIAPVLGNMIIIFLFVIPLIMMRSFAEEKRQRTEELLRTSPITSSQLLMGKFFGALIFLVILLVPTGLYQGLLFVYSSPELGPVLTGYLSVALFGCAGISIGLFASSLTNNQIIAAVVTFVILLFMVIVNIVRISEGSILYEVVRYISVRDHTRNLLQGLIDTKDLVYFASVTGLFLFLTKRSIESVGWR